MAETATLRQAVRQVFDVMVERFARNDILTYASAVAVQLLTAVIPLGLLAFLLLGAFGEQSTWREDLGPKFAGRASVQTYEAVDAVVEGLIATTHRVWLAAATVIAIWEISGAVRACMGGLNRIFEHDETRPIGRRFGLSFLLAVAIGLLVLGAMLVATRGGGWVDLGAAQPVWTVVRWGSTIVLVWAAVLLLFRFAPNGHQPPALLTAGSVLVVVAWVAASLVFGWWVFTEANYKSPFGTAVALLTLVGYLYTSAIVFLVGAQVDQLLVEQERAGSGGPLPRIR